MEYRNSALQEAVYILGKMAYRNSLIPKINLQGNQVRNIK